MKKEEEIVVWEEVNEKEVATVEEDTNTGTNNYNKLLNKPKINNIVLQDNKTSKELGLQEEMDSLTNIEIEEIIKNFI